MNTFLVLTMISSSMSLPSDRVKGLLARIPNTCSTRTGESCVFPFTYKGVEHYHCTYADSPTAWCATLTDSQGVVVTNKWGDCDTGSLSSCQPETISPPSCTTQSGPYPNQACVFPFRYNGVTYTSCTTQDKSDAWCSTNTTLAGTHIPGYFGYCPSTCLAESRNSCTPGTSYSVDCNTCVCGADGLPVCTSLVCGSSSTTSTTTTSTTTTTTSTTTCTPGTVSTVDCNTCVCSSLGEQVCTTTVCTTSAPSSTCTTVSGPDTASQCVFPFTFGGVTHQSCADWIYGGVNAGSKWCSTKVDVDGVHVNGEGNYGFCGAACDLSVDLVQQIFGTNIRKGLGSSGGAVQFGGRAQG